MDSATRLQKILVDSPVGSVLPAICCKQQRFAIALLNLPNWWLAGGAVRNIALLLPLMRTGMIKRE
jgi:hypothetical protein